MRDGRVVQSRNRLTVHAGSLTIGSVSLQDTGRYDCVAENVVGRASKSIFLQVQGERDFRLFCKFNHHHHHQSLNREGPWGTTDDFATSFLHFSLFSTALWDLPNSSPVHSLMLSSHLFLCPSCLLPPFTVPCKMVLARPDERET